MLFPEFCAKARKSRDLPELDPELVVLSFDPGHTTGWCTFQGTEMEAAGQLGTDAIEKVPQPVQALLQDYEPDIVVMEDYRVYKWRQKHHVGSEMLTTRIIGSIETVTVMFDATNPIEITKQPAHIAKGFCTDTRLKDWGLWRPHSERHARDAIRHACYFLAFGAIRHKDRSGPTVG